MRRPMSTAQTTMLPANSHPSLSALANLAVRRRGCDDGSLLGRPASEGHYGSQTGPAQHPAVIHSRNIVRQGKKGLVRRVGSGASIGTSLRAASSCHRVACARAKNAGLWDLDGRRYIALVGGMDAPAVAIRIRNRTNRSRPVESPHAHLLLKLHRHWDSRYAPALEFAVL
ncbi:exported hypothetical protein [Mesorhizobium plurifarium]|uniref:Uncharacterized protein n=1 Tax=Mesorhizobium plurifarium TaxID=69974 RepID=A0A090E5S9_MESPL|nr:exported hypothetical protein [Mesorhizobium plurifarium]